MLLSTFNGLQAESFKQHHTSSAAKHALVATALGLFAGKQQPTFLSIDMPPFDPKRLAAAQSEDARQLSGLGSPGRSYSLTDVELAIGHGPRLALCQHSIAAAPSSRQVDPKMAAIAVRTNPKFADLVPAYLQNCRLNAGAMADALNRIDFETVKFLGHQMKGSGGAFGFQGISDIGAALQEAAEGGNASASRKCVDELSLYLDRVVTASG